MTTVHLLTLMLCIRAESSLCGCYDVKQLSQWASKQGITGDKHLELSTACQSTTTTP